MALKLLHTADWHLGLRFPRFAAEQEQRLTRARLEVVSRILDLAERRNVDGVLCAGDLFDEPAPQEQWWRGLRDELDRRSWTRPVFLLPGNHDPLTPRSPWDPSHSFRLGLPDYVNVIDRDDFTYEFGDVAVLHAVPCRSHAGQDDPTEKIPSRQSGDNRIRIGLVHGQTFDLKNHQTNFPIAGDATEKRGLDYLAIGDTHSFREVVPDALAPTVYPGAPEPTAFDEDAAGHVALVFFPKDRSRRARIDRHTVGRWTWREEPCRSVAELRVLSADESLLTSVLRLTVEMEVGLGEYDEVDQLLTELAGSLSAHPRVGVLEIERSRLLLRDTSADDFPDELPPIIASVVTRLRERASIEPEKTTRALYHLYRLVQTGAKQ